MCDVDDDNVHHYIGERLKLEGETKNMVVTKKSLLHCTLHNSTFNHDSA